ncbi:MAG: class I SAM-dependent methyltransferase [Candidatus Helarchaeota archaeon]
MIIRKSNLEPFQKNINYKKGIINEKLIERDISLTVEKFYDQQAQIYSDLQWNSTPISLYDFFFTKKNLLQFLQLRNSDEILEIGCGSGTWTRLFAEKCKDVTAIDISKNMISNAKMNVSLPNISFHNTDFLKLNFKKKFDTIVSVRVIEYCQNKIAFLEKCYQLLKSEGKLVIISKMKPSLWGIIRNFRNFLKRFFLQDNPQFRDLVWMKKISPKDIIKFMKKIGYSKIYIKPVIIRLPIFKRGNHEIPIIPKRLENKLLKFFSKFQNRIIKLPNFLLPFKLLFSESYIIRGDKNLPRNQ